MKTPEEIIGEVWLDMKGGHEEQQIKAIFAEYGCDDEALAKFVRRLDAAGYAIVPKEPTPDMRWAGSKAKNAHRLIGGARASLTEIYRAMIDDAQTKKPAPDPQRKRAPRRKIGRP